MHKVIEVIGDVINIDDIDWLVKVETPTGNNPWLLLTGRCAVDEITLKHVLDTNYAAIQLPYLMHSEYIDDSELLKRHGEVVDHAGDCGFYPVTKATVQAQSNVVFNPKGTGDVRYHTTFALVYEGECNET